MMRIEMSEVVNRPVEHAWKVLTNFDNWAKAAKSASEFRQTSPGALGVGATVESRRTILGRTLKIHDIVITEYEPNRVLAMTDKAPGLRPGAQRFTFEPDLAGTRVTRSIELDLGRGRLLEPLVTPLLRRIWRYEGAAMKRVMEADA
jgi:carbon monoxide dehydrogenase subunit G